MRKLIIFLFAIISCASLESQESGINSQEYLPDIDGILKTKVEFDLNNSRMRFEVRNARFGARGKVNNYIAYRAEVDLSDEGKIKMLDAYVKFSPLANLDFYMGQRKIPFSTDYMRSPAENFFANRSFLAKYINDGMRDIGFYADYRLPGAVPLNFLIGAVNGTGNNNPQWISRPNLAGRVTAGSESGFRVAGNVYYGEASDRYHLALFGGEVRYSHEAFFIESEYISRNWTDTLSVRNHDEGIYIHSFYNINLKSKMLKKISPVARWDMMGGSLSGGNTEASRLTFGLNAGFEPKQFVAEIRMNYEIYLKRSLPVHTDKLTLEFIARF